MTLLITLAEWRYRLPDLRPIVAGLVIGGLADILGLTHRDGLVVALVVMVIGYVAVAASRGSAFAWPPVDLEATDGTRRDVTRLTWSLIGRDGRVTEAAVRRLRADAHRRLAGHGVDLATDPAGAAALLGADVVATLTTHGGIMPSVRELGDCVVAVEKLGPARPAPRPAPVEDPAPTGPAPTGPAPAGPAPAEPPDPASATPRPSPAERPLP